MFRFVHQSTASMRATSYLVFALVAMLFSIGRATAQSGKNDTFRQKVISLNALADDEPATAMRKADSLMIVAKSERRTEEYGLLLMVKGVAETTLGNNTSALKNHMRAYDIFDSIKNKRGKIYSLCNIAAVHLNVNDYRKAENYLLRALAITPAKDYNNLKNIYVNLGVVYQYSGNQQKAIETYRKTIPVLLMLKDYDALAITYHNMGESYNLQHDFPAAEKHELIALDYQKKSGSPSTLAIISLSLGSLYTHNGHLDKSLLYLRAGGKAALELDSPYYKDVYYLSMAEYYKASGQPKGEAESLNKLLKLRDSTHLEEIATINSEIEGKFQSRLKAKEIEVLKAEKELADSKAERNRIGWIVLCVVSFLCIVIIVVLYRNYKLKQKANLLLGKEKSKLEEQNLRLENENILVQFETLRNQVSPHFLFNSLNALASLIKHDPDKALEFTGVFSKLFRNTLELKDRHLITVTEEVQHVQSYLYLQKMRFGESLIVDVAIPADSLKMYLPPFSLQLVVENAIKHNVVTEGRPLTISISTSNVRLVVTNNYQPRQHVEDSTGTGIRNIISRYKYLDAGEPSFGVRNDEYIVELPLINEE